MIVYGVYQVLTELLFFILKFLDFFNVSFIPDFQKRVLFLNALGRKKIWFHAASVGEVRGIFSLVTQTLRDYRSDEIIFTVTSTSGEAEVKRLFPDIEVCLVPFDSPSVVRKFLKNHQPKLLIINETELWPAMIVESFKFGVQCFLVNGRISDKTFPIYNFFSFFFRGILEKFSKIFVQSQIDYERFHTIGNNRQKLVITGSTKYDFPIGNGSHEFISWWHEVCETLGLEKETFILVFGSVREEEENIIFDCVSRIHRELGRGKVFSIVAPRHPERFFPIKELFKIGGFEVCARLDDILNPSSEVLILNKIGELLSAYEIADVCFVGGTFSNAGGHNILEPANFSKPILTGLNTANMKEIAVRLEAEGGLSKLEDSNMLADKIIELLKDPELRRKMGKASFKVNEQMKGATLKIYSEMPSL